VFFLNGLSFVAVIVALLMMRIEANGNETQQGFAAEKFLAGFSVAMSDLPVRSALLLLSV